MTGTESTRALRWRHFHALLGLFPAGRLVDLGAGHGLFSRAAADRGWQVTAVDARADRFPADPRVTWVVQDVRETALDDVDLVLCLGLFYHLTLADQLGLLERAAGRPLMIDTHLDVGSGQQLSPRTTVDGYDGSFYGETPDTPMSSWRNDKSFWPTRDSFFRMLVEHGYATILTAAPWVTADRTFFLALPTG